MLVVRYDEKIKHFNKSRLNEINIYTLYIKARFVRFGGFWLVLAMLIRKIDTQQAHEKRGAWGIFHKPKKRVGLVPNYPAKKIIRFIWY